MGRGPSLKWTQLTIDDFQYLFELNEAFLNVLIEDFDMMRKRIHLPMEIGRGIRGRSEKFNDYSETYKYSVTRSRQIGFAPYLSTIFAFLSEESKIKIWEHLRDGAKKILGCEVMLPPIMKGNYWKRILDYHYEGYNIVNADGTNWESMVSRILDNYIFAVDDGCYQLMSGSARTSIDGCFANLKLAEVMYKGMDIEAIGVLGDDRVTVGSSLSRARCHIDNVMEIDQIATKHKIILGMVLVPNSRGEYKGTYPGTIRISIDRGAKAQPFKLGEWIKGVSNDMTDDSFKVYLEMASHGTIHNEPLIEYISSIDDDEFWDRYSEDRYKYFGELNERKDEHNKGRPESGLLYRGRSRDSMERYYIGRYSFGGTTRPSGESNHYAQKSRIYFRGRDSSKGGGSQGDSK
jgi:hypothetical protein